METNPSARTRSDVKRIFTTQEVEAFTEKNDLINVAALIIIYGLAILAIALFKQFPNFWYAVPVFIFMGAVQHTLGTFVHESAHLHMFSDRKTNDLVGHYLCAAPLMSYLKDYRYFHFEHHRHTGNIEKDPELNMYRSMGLEPSFASKTEVLKVFKNDLNGINFLRTIKYLISFFNEKRANGSIPMPTKLENLAVVFWLTLMPLLMWSLGLLVPYLLFWILPQLTISPILLRWHSYGEHVREKNGCDSDNTITHRMGFLATLFLYPINSSFHLEHHAFPQLPWYRIKKFYFWAMQNPEYKAASQKLTVSGFFLGEKSVFNTVFPVDDKK